MIGTTFGLYRVHEKPGQGGMGVVYEAQDTDLERMAAVKLLRAKKAPDAERRRSFVREAKCASALNHSNIANLLAWS